MEPTCCPLERDAMLEAARTLVGFYMLVAPPLAAEHGIEYPEGLERVVLRRFDVLSGDDTP